MGNSITTEERIVPGLLRGAKSKTSENFSMFKWNISKEFGVEVL